MDLKSLNISEFVRYVLSGFNFVLFIIAIPLIYLYPDNVKDILDKTSVLMFSIVSIAIGYLLDSLKIYKLTPNYKKQSSKFMNDVAELLEIPKEQTSAYFSLATEVSKKSNYYKVERRRSEWILASHTTIIFMIAAIVWSTALMYKIYTGATLIQTLIPFLAIGVSIALSIRLFRNASQERLKANKEFLAFLKENKSTVLGGWKIDV